MEKKKTMEDTFRVQAKIRENAASLQSFSSDLARWQSSIKKKDEELRKKSGSSRLNNAASTPAVRMAPTAKPEESKKDAHTYDKGYKKWESFDVEKELAQVDGESIPPKVTTPATIAAPYVVSPETPVVFPDADVTKVKTPRDVLERERGNEYYKKGQYEQAVKYYTRAVGFNPRSAAAYSNRAMAYLKLKDFQKAEEDCTSALARDEGHLKSLCRRGTARNALGRHRCAFLDFARVRELDPTNKQALSEINKTRELIKSSVRKAPRSKVDTSGLVVVQSLKENTQHQNPVVVEEGKKKKVALGAKTVNVEKKASVPAVPKPSVVRKETFQTPKTLYEFERVWKELRRDLPARSELVVRKLGGEGIRKLFKKSAPEAEMLCEIFTALEQGIPQRSPGEIFNIVKVFDQIPGIRLSLMFLSDVDRKQLERFLGQLEQEGMETSRLVNITFTKK